MSHNENRNQPAEHNQVKTQDKIANAEDLLYREPFHDRYGTKCEIPTGKERTRTGIEVLITTE